MNLGQNKFLVGSGVVMLIGCGILGFFLWQAGSQFSDLNDTYVKQVDRLKTLQHQTLYPEQSNVDRLARQKDEAAKAAAAFQAQIRPMAFALEPISPEQFQDRLRTTVSEVVKSAKLAKVLLPDKFYLGFNEYQAKPPTVEAAPALNRELKAIELAVRTVIDSRVTAITGIKRDPLPEEEDTTKETTMSQARGGAKAPALFTEYPFQVQFASDQPPFRRVIDALSSNQKQFFVISSVQLKNSVDKPIMKEMNTPVASATPVPTVSVPGVMATAGAASGAPAENLKFLVGIEHLNVTLGLKMVVFASAGEK